MADSAPDAYTSGIETGVARIDPHVNKNLRGLIGSAGQLTYGYFTFTNDQGTFTGYATPDFTRFTIQISFDLP